MSACSGAKEVAWMEKLAMDIDDGNTTDQSLYLPTLFTDNTSGIDWFKNAKINEKSKHIELQYYWIRKDLVEGNRLRIQHVAGQDQLADVLTKQLPLEGFTRHVEAMGLTSSLFSNSLK